MEKAAALERNRVDRTIGTSRSLFIIALAALSGVLSSCGGGGDGTSGSPASVYSIGGTATGPFTFAQKLGAGTAYSVAIGTAPAGQTCTLANAAGTVGSSNITNVAVACTPDSYTIGGTVSGLPQGTNLELLDNAADVAWVNSNGPFTFATAVPSGAS